MDQESEVVIVTNVYGDICIRKARRKRQKLLVKELMYDYANNTTLHGLPYVTRTGLTLIEKIFWLITFLASVSMCLFLISKVWFKWQTSPVIVTVSEQLVPVYKVPFPSVTICPQSKCKISVYNFTNEIKIVDAFLKQNDSSINHTMTERLIKFHAISRICNHPFKHHVTAKLYPKKHTDMSFVDSILEVAPDYSDVFRKCSFHGVNQTCETMFDKVLTGEGLCFNMNSLAATEIFRSRKLQHDYKYLYTVKRRKGWSVEHGYDEFIPSNGNLEDPNFYPVPGAENGRVPDVEVELLHRPDERDKLCNGLNSGFKVYIQHPTDLPQSSLYYYAVLHNQVSSMALSFNVLNTSESLRGYDPDVRQCYFPDERYLMYFSEYTASNCRLECLSNVTNAICGCVEFYMPYLSSTRICTAMDNDCLPIARRVMQHQELAKNGTRCHCLPACNSMDYEAEILKTDFNLKRSVKIYNQAVNSSDEHLKGYNFSKLEMYFKRPRFLSMRRSELFGVIDFLANCGGLLGLFLGFSFLSLVEIFYFLSLRLCCTLKKDLEEEKSQKEPEKGITINKY